MTKPATPETETSSLPTDTAQPVPAALRIRVLREALDRMEGKNGDEDSATEQVGAATVRAVFREMSAEMDHRAATPPQTLRGNPDGSWGSAQPVPLTDDFDVEVTGHGPWTWEAWVGMTEVATGVARTRIGLWFAITRAKRRHAKETQR